MVVEQEPTQEVKKNQLLGLLHLQSTPRKAEVVTWGYDLGTWYGRRDNCATALLALLLFVTAITVSGLTSSMQLIYVQADLCKTRESTLSANLVTMRNITNYYDAKEASSMAVNVTATAYYQAEETYNALGLRFEWPSPYDLSEEERQALEQQAREGGDDCEPVEKCVGGVVGAVGGFFGADTCAEAEVPCPDIESTELLVSYDASQKSLDLFGNNATDSEQEEIDTTLAQTALDKATDAISVLVRRINFASSIYVLYLAFLVVVTPPFIVYGAKWNMRIFDFLANVNKPMWITLIVLVWYAHEFFKSIINSSLYKVIWGNFLQDPCWADPDFLVNTSLVIRDTCTDITSAHNLFNQAAANYRYYDTVEATWQAVAAGEGGPYYGDPDVDFPQDFPGNCSATTLLDAIQPGDGSVNWWSLFFHSGALVALLLQLVVAHWFISWFCVLRPLTMNRGRVMIPESSQSDEVLFREVRSFARRRAVLPFAFTTAVLVLLLVNLGASSSDEDMPRKVLIGALLVFFFQFGVVPLLIWRPVDERTMPVVKFVASHRLGPGSGAGAALAEANLPPSSSSSSSSHEEEAWQSVSPSPSPRGTDLYLNTRSGSRTSPEGYYYHHNPLGVGGDGRSQGHWAEEELNMDASGLSGGFSNVLQAPPAATTTAAAVGQGGWDDYPRYR